MASIGNGAGSIRRIELDYRSHVSLANLLIMLCRSWKALQVIAVHDKNVYYTKQYDCNLYNAKNKGQNVNVPTVSTCNSNAIRQKCSIVTKKKNKTEHGQARLRVPAAQNSSRRRSQRHDPIDRLGMCCAGIRVARVFNTQTPAHARTHTHTHTHTKCKHKHTTQV